jgi:hypothetical protein
MPNDSTPYIDNSGHLVIPFNSDPKYQYWNGGQSLAETLHELNATEEVSGKYVLKTF